MILSLDHVYKFSFVHAFIDVVVCILFQDRTSSSINKLFYTNSTCSFKYNHCADSYIYCGLSYEFYDRRQHYGHHRDPTEHRLHTSK